MAHIEKRGPRRYRARYVVEGRERSKTFDRKIDAERFLAGVQADLLRGSYLDPDAGRITLSAYAGEWLAAQTFDHSTREATALRLRLHVLPHLGEYRLAALRPSQVQAWVRALQQTLAPRYVRVIVANLSAVLAAAVDDEKIARNPCSAASVKLPRLDPNKVRPWTRDQVLAVHGALPARYQVAATLGAGCGLRQGEVFGLAVDDVDFLRGVVHVRRQVKIVGSRLVFALPKGRKLREVPLPEAVALELASHLAACPAHEVELPWETPAGEKRARARLVLTSRERLPLNRSYVNSSLWKPALVAAGLQPTRENGMHALRHFYASVLLDAGESVRALAEYLGHADPGFTLRVYTHLMPASENRTKKAIDRVLGEPNATADGLAAAWPAR